MYQTIGMEMPNDFLVIAMPGYDGGAYYKIARNIPKIFNPTAWSSLREHETSPYNYQRILLPFLGYIFAVGQKGHIAASMILVNFMAIVLTFVIMQFESKRPSENIYSLALCLSPAATIAMHFVLAEPLSLLLTTFVLLRWEKWKTLDTIDSIALSLLVLSREINIVFVCFLAAYMIGTRRSKEVAMLIMPYLVFMTWHLIIYSIFGTIPFLMSTAAHALPGKAIIEIVLAVKDYNSHTLSSIVLFLGFVVPGWIWTAQKVYKTRGTSLLPIGAFTFLSLMLIMPPLMWGSITSIGRIITPVYPLTIIAYRQEDSRLTRILAMCCGCIGVGALLGLSLIHHPYI